MFRIKFYQFKLTPSRNIYDLFETPFKKYLCNIISLDTINTSLWFMVNTIIYAFTVLSSLSQFKFAKRLVNVDGNFNDTFTATSMNFNKD